MNGEVPALSGVAILTANLTLGTGPQVFVVAVVNLSHDQTLTVQLGDPPHYGFAIEDAAGQQYWSWEGPILDPSGEPLTQFDVLPRQYATFDHIVESLDLGNAPDELLLKGYLRSLTLPFSGQLGVRM